MSDTSKQEELIEEARAEAEATKNSHYTNAPLLFRMADALEAAEQAHTPTDDERESLARVIDPGEWEDVRPRPGSFPDAPEAQATYERFFWEGVENRRKTSLLIADRLIAAGIGFRRTAVPTDAERGSAEGALWDVVERLSLPLTGVEVQALAESVARRTAVQEPSAGRTGPCGFGLEQCRCELPSGHSGMHECRDHRFSDRPLWEPQGEPTAKFIPGSNGAITHDQWPPMHTMACPVAMARAAAGSGQEEKR